MKIDWFTVIAQAINFLILVLLMKRFLYKPVLQVIGEREKYIKAQLNEGETRKIEAEKTREEFSKKNEELARNRLTLIAKVKEEAETERAKLLEQSKQEATDLRTKLQQSIKEEQDRLHQQVAIHIQQEIFAISAKALTDLASVKLEDQIIEVFISKLTELNDQKKQQVTLILKESKIPAIVRSAAPLIQAQKEKVENTLKKLFSAVQVQFEVTPELIAGVELIVDGYRLSWNIQEYLNTMENKISMLINEKPEIV